jgi:hypothetical protein
MFEGLLLHTIAFPHIFGFLPIIAGALASWGAGSVIVGSTLSAVAAKALLIGGGLAGAGYMGGQKSAAAAREQANRANDATERRFWYDVENWNLQKDKIQADHAYATEMAHLQARNEQSLANWKDASNLANYQYELQIRNARQESNLKQYAKSENIYGDQITLNALSAQAGKEDELRSLAEIHTETSFDANEAYLQNLKAEGQLRAKGIKGRSIGKAEQATLADYGRQMALLSESLASAGRNSRAVLKEIQRDHFSADLTAYAQRMLEPGVEPMPIIPYATPVAEFALPRALSDADYGAMPVMGAQMSPNAAANQVWGQTISGIAGSAIGSMAGAGFTRLFNSDIGLKENLEYIEKSPSGINVYEWNYKGDTQKYRGVIAQDLIAQGRHDAVSEQDNGYLAVDYTKLDVQMTPV